MMLILLVIQLFSSCENIDSVSLTGLQSLAEETVLLMYLLSKIPKDITQLFLKLTCTLLPFLLTHTQGW